MEKLEGRKLHESEVVQLLKSKHLQTAKKGEGDSSVDVSNYSEWNFKAAKSIVTKLHSDQVITEIVMKQETAKGSESCFNSLSKLEKLAQRPSCLASRRFIFQLFDDLLCHGLLPHDEVSKDKMVGSGSNPGLIHLFEFKWRALSFIFDIMAVQAKLKDEDRTLLKERMCDPPSARGNTQDNVGWQGALTKSSLEALTFIHELVFLKKYDNVMKQAMKPNSHPEILTEMETIQESWKLVVSMRENELAEEKAALQAMEGAKSEDDSALEDNGPEHLLQQARKTPNSLPHGSPSFWKAVSNQTVRMYTNIVVEAANSASLVASVEKEGLPVGEVGKACILVHLDTSLLGEGTGPGAQEGLRKVWRPDEAVINKLLGSALLGLGAQADKSGKCNAPGEAVVAAVVDPLNVWQKSLLKDSCSQTVWLCFNEARANDFVQDVIVNIFFFKPGTALCEESIRARKKKVRSHSYSQRLELNLYSEKSLGVVLPEKPRQCYSGYSSGDCIGFITAMPIGNMWRVPRRFSFNLRMAKI